MADLTFKRIGEKTGFIFAYFLFTTILFFILKITHNVPTLRYLHIVGITIIIVFLGGMLQRFIK